MHVLAVADDRDKRDVLCALLEAEDYHVTAVPAGHVALAYLWMRDESLAVLVDYRRPWLTGTELVEAYLHAGSPPSRREFDLLTDVPHVATSLNGRVPVVDKPFDSEALLGAVAKVAARLGPRWSSRSGSPMCAFARATSCASCSG